MMAWLRSHLGAKLALAVLAPVVLSLAAISTTAFIRQRNALIDDVTDGLEAVAAVQEARVEAYQQTSLESMALVASRTQLRRSLAADLESPDAANVELMNRILADAVASSGAVRSATLVAPDGSVRASSAPDRVGESITGQAWYPSIVERPRVDIVVLVEERLVGIHGTPVSLDGTSLGTLVLEVDLEPLLALVGDTTGLGETGESILVANRADTGPAWLTPLRFDPDAALEAADGVPAQQAASGSEEVFTDSLDYRGERVFAATRFVESSAWGIVVKQDRSEALAPVVSLRRFLIAATLLTTIVSLLILAAIITPVTRRLSLLRDSADAIGGGDLSVRATVKGTDEVATLADRFNHMTDELVATNHQLGLKNEQLEEFVFVASHDLKTPLRSISSFAQLLEMQHGEQLGQQGQESLYYIRTAAARMHLLIEDLQTYLRIDQAQAESRPVAVGPIIEELMTFHGPVLEDADATIEVDQDLPSVAANKTHLRQVFDNLLTNAVRYRQPTQNLSIHIHADQFEDRVMIHTDDNGIGIPDEHRERVLGVFERLDDTTEGTGMGLAICARIARTYGGDFVLDASPLGGTRATITLPTLPQHLDATGS